MIYFRDSISVCNSVDQAPQNLMANSINSSDLHPKPRNRKPQVSSPSCQKFPVCDRSRSAAVDVVILVAVIFACGFLFFPYIKFITVKLAELSLEFAFLAKQEIYQNPIVVGSIALSVPFAAISAWMVFLLCGSRKCGNPQCKGLRNAAEFDIQLEAEDCIKNTSNSNPSSIQRGLFELISNHHRELEAELKKMAPPNGRAVLLFRAKCGCSVGRFEVPGPKKQRKTKR